jgi:hypothetical protein
MRHLTPRILGWFSLVLLGCAGASHPGSSVPAHRAGLVGLWTGRFEPDANPGQRGTLRVRVMGDGDTAYGYLVLGDTISRTQCSQEHAEFADGKPLLRFHSLQVTSTGIAGWVEPFHDLALGCRIDTWFEGNLTGDSLHGTYYARPADGSRTRLGHWWAVRRE